MSRPRILIQTIIALLVSLPALASDYDIIRMDDGPFSFEISGITINEGSSLMRESILFNDSSCPVQLSKHELSIKFKDRDFHFAGRTTFSVSVPSTAVEIRTALFDVFGQHMHNFSNSEPRDMAPGNIAITGEWRTRGNDVSELLTTVTYVARLRLADGTQWVFNRDNLQMALSSLDLENKIEDDEE